MRIGRASGEQGILMHLKEWFLTPLGATTFFFYSSFLFLFFFWLPLNFPIRIALHSEELISSCVATILYLVALFFVFKQNSTQLLNGISWVCLGALLFHDVLHPSFAVRHIGSYFHGVPKESYLTIILISSIALFCSILFGKSLSFLCKKISSRIAYSVSAAFSGAVTMYLFSFLVLVFSVFVKLLQNQLDWHNYPIYVILIFWGAGALFNSILVVPLGSILGCISSVVYKKLNTSR